MSDIRRPGPGWTQQPVGAVWDHTSGLRVHVLGVGWLPSGKWIDGRRWPESQNLERAVREQGGNIRRGAMVWALRQANEPKESCSDDT